MNVFAPSPSPRVSASWLADQHVVKMCVETAQILSSAMILNGHSSVGLYKPTHVHHPCVKMAQQDPEYFGWVVQHGFSLADEYQIRYGRRHASLSIIENIAGIVSHVNSDSLYKPKSWPLAMPENLRGEDPHESYLIYLFIKYTTWEQKGGRVSPHWKRIVADNPFVAHP